jgi:hypothetical protein
MFTKYTIHLGGRPEAPALLTALGEAEPVFASLQLRLGLQTLAASFHFRRHVQSGLPQETSLSIFVLVRKKQQSSNVNNRCFLIFYLFY